MGHDHEAPYCDRCGANHYPYCGDEEPRFRDPGGTSALRAGKIEHPCPSCGEISLTAADVAKNYQCDPCADALERGIDR